MENCDVPVHLQTGGNSRGRRISARKPGLFRQCPCCRDDQVPNLHPKHKRSAAPVDPPQKRQWTSAASPAKPSAAHLEALNFVPARRPSAPAADLPVASAQALGLQPATAPLQHDSTLRIHNRSVEQYQQIYHEVVDDMLKFKNGRDRPYSLALGRCIKQKLWERLNRPMFSTSADGGGLEHVDVSYGVGVCPPTYHVDIMGEPKPQKTTEEKS